MSLHLYCEWHVLHSRAFEGQNGSVRDAWIWFRGEVEYCQELFGQEGSLGDRSCEVCSLTMTVRTSSNPMTPTSLDITDDALNTLIKYYCREAGVRNLQVWGCHCVWRSRNILKRSIAMLRWRSPKMKNVVKRPTGPLPVRTWKSTLESACSSRTVYMRQHHQV